MTAPDDEAFRAAPVDAYRFGPLDWTPERLAILDAFLAGRGKPIDPMPL